MKQMDIDLFRDASWLRELQICDDVGDPIDITDASFACTVTDRPAGSVLAAGTVEKIDNAEGRVNLFFDGPDYVGYGHLQQPTTAYYRLHMTQAAVVTNIVAGYLNLLPGN